MNKTRVEKCIHWKIGKSDATSRQIVWWLKCTNFDFRRDSAPDPAGGVTRRSRPPSCIYRHSLQFTINKIVYKIFRAMSKDLYIEISAHFGIESVENSVANRRNRFINRYGETYDYLCQMLRWLVRLSECIFGLLRLYNFCLLNLFICCVLPYTMVT